MLDKECIRSIKRFQDPFIRSFIFDSNSWYEFASKVNQLGNGREQNKTKGDVFELFTCLYLASDPIFSSKLESIWHHSNVPYPIVEKLDLQLPEIGIDLITKSKDGDIWAFQCKYHSDISKNVSYEEVSTFFSITNRPQTFNNITHRIICSSTYEVSKKIRNAEKNKLGYLTFCEFSQLGKEEFYGFHSLLKNEKISLESYEPRNHQINAIEKSIRYFSTESRGKLVHPCGAGKSLTGYWIFRHLSVNNTLIIVPSLQLVRQTLKAWARELLCDGVEIDWIAICSDDDVRNVDDPAMNISDIGIEVNTDIEVISKFLTKKTNNKKIVITTYQSGKALINAAQFTNFNFELGIFDEAHKTAGNKNKLFAQLLYDENIFIKKRLFMTATERVFRGDSDETISMDDEVIYGRIVDEFSFKSALEQKPKILSDYQISTTATFKNEIKELIENNELLKAGNKQWTFEADASTFAALITLRKAVQELKVKHVISFHRSISRAREFQQLNDAVNNFGTKFGYIHSYHINGKKGTGKRSEIINRFISEEPSLITNARCLTEGVDIPEVDAVLFADPKDSTVDIVQAAGRAMRVSDNKELGYILLPVMLDEEENNSIEDSAFKQIIKVVSALGMSDERIVAEFQEIAQGNNPTGRRIVDIEEVFSSINLESLYSNINFRIWNRLSFASKFINLNQEILIAEIGKSGDRWKQANFPLKIWENYFGGDLKLEKYIHLYEVNRNGSLNKKVSTKIVKVKSQNYRVELGAVAGINYPDSGRPIGIFKKISQSEFRYHIFMPEDPMHPNLLGYLNIRGKGYATSLKGALVFLNQLESLWPDCPV